MAKGGFVGISNGDILRECELNGAVRDSERRKPNGADGDLGFFRLENGEVNGKNYDNQENQEYCGQYTRGQVCPARGWWPARVRFVHS